MVQGLLQKVTMTAAPDLMMQGGMKQFERYAGPLTPEQRKSVDEWIPRLKADAATARQRLQRWNDHVDAGPVIDVMRTDDRKDR